MRLKFAVILSLLFATVALSQEFAWRDESGQPIEETESQRSADGFAGLVLITPDPDWEEKWRTPPETTPHYTVTSTVRVGETVMLLVFFANPAVDDDGIAEIRCDFKMTRPDGSISIDVEDAECYRGPIHGDPYAVRLSNGLLGFVGEEDDVRGEWIADVVLTDAVRGVSLDLRTRFVLVDAEG